MTSGRNAPCKCGSGKKAKKCCGDGNVTIARKSVTKRNTGDSMGLFHEYIRRRLTPEQIEAERKIQLRRIGELLDCDILTYAARMSPMPVPAPIAVMNDDVLPFIDLLDGLKKSSIAVILETPGGAGEIGRQLVEILHERFGHVRFIVPGTAKSTGTIMVLGGHEILMGPGSALGPIDAQLQQDGKVYSADALIEGMNRIKADVEASEGRLNPVYIPILQKLSPGEIEHAHNALDFARDTVREWLVKYKFGKWDRRETSGEPVTAEYKTATATRIATELSSQAKWKTHGRGIRAADLTGLGLKVTDYSKDHTLYDAIQRYYILLTMSFDSGNIYKLFETPDAVVAKRFQPPQQQVQQSRQLQLPPPDQVGSAMVGVVCGRCKKEAKLQIDFKPGIPLEDGALRYPPSGHIACPGCGQSLDCKSIKENLERQIGRPALNPQPTG